MKRLFFLILLSIHLDCALCEAESSDASHHPDSSAILQLSRDYKYDNLKKCGPAIVDPILDLYEKSDNADKTKLAQSLYALSYKSERARDVLMKDVHTADKDLRLQVQWALGRVSNDDTVVKTLLDNMQNDPNPLFRDKAACALANDQVHLTEKQRAMLLEGLVNALEDDKDDVRRIALLALQIQTGQTKGFNPNALWPVRKIQIQKWKSWIEEYKQNIPVDK